MKGRDKAMKKLSKKVAYVACNGGCHATADCVYGCVACGVCVSVCPFEAIEINAVGVAEVDSAKCLGCGKCTKECPRGVLRVHDRLQPIVVSCSNHDAGKAARTQCERSCIACGLCAKACPSGAITVEENLSQIDESICLVCGQCLVKCPRGTITDVRGILRK